MARMFPHFGGWPGSEGYAQIAWNLSHRGLFSADGTAATTERMPLYPMILAALMRLAGGGWRPWAAVMNALALAASAGIATRLCNRLYSNPRATWACALLLALHVAWTAEALALRETVWFALAVIGLASVLTTQPIPPGRLIAAGALAGAAYLLRPTGFLLIGLFPIWLWAVRSDLPRPLVPPVALALALAGLAVGSWQSYSIRATGQLQISDSEGGITAFKGAIPEFWVAEPWVDLDLLNPLADERARLAGARSLPERDRYWRDEAVRTIRDDPAQWIAKGFLKVAELLSPVGTPFGYGRINSTGGSSRLEGFRWDPWTFASVPSAVLILGGAVRRMSRWRALPGPERSLAEMAAILLALLCLVHAATSGETRFRLPFDPLLAVLAAPSAAGLWAGAARRLRGRPATADR